MWPLLKYWIIHRNDDDLIKNLKKIYHIHPKHTIIYKIIELGIQANTSDVKFFDDIKSPHDLPTEPSYKLDLSATWIKPNVTMNSFTDDQVLPTNALLIFTDGSVDKQASGYGAITISTTDYQQLLQKPLKQAMLHYTTSTGYPSLKESLSQGCSIDFCEAYAIRDILVQLQHDIQTQTQSPGYLNNTKHLMITSDSRVVLGWIDGEYIPKNPQIYNILKDIHWTNAL